MADYATINTPRLRVRYRVQSKAHAIVFRGHRGATDGGAALRTAAQEFLNALAPWRFNDWAVLGADYAGADSELFFPTTAPTVTAGAASATNIAQRTVFTSFVGRSITGSRAVLMVYGINSDPVGATSAEQDFRLARAEYAPVGAALDALADNTDALAAIDDGEIIWNQYANLAYNAYYQRKARNG